MSVEIDKLAWLRIEGNRVLGARSQGKDFYYLPGGKRDSGESDEAALMREIREELSVSLHPESIHYAQTFRAQADGKEEGVIVKMTCYEADYDGILRPSAEVEEICWMSYRDRARCSLVVQDILDTLHAQGRIE